MFSKKNKYLKYVHVYIICTNIRFPLLCFSCKCSVCVCSSVLPGKLQYLAVQVSPASCHHSVSWTSRVALSAPGAQLELPAQFFSLLCLSPAGLGCRQLLRCAKGAASTVGTPVSSSPVGMCVGAAVPQKVLWS